MTQLDAVVISHAHLDHCGLVPFLYKYGYDGPVYCSAPTSNLMTMLQLDYLDVANKQGVTPFYDQKDVRECVLHTIPLRFGVVTDIAPDIRLTLHNSGHILGGAMVHLHIGEGLHNIVYTGDYKFGRTMLLEAAATEFPRIETVITESTYSGPDDIVPSRIEAEEALTKVINATLGTQRQSPHPRSSSRQSTRNHACHRRLHETRHDEGSPSIHRRHDQRSHSHPHSLPRIPRQRSTPQHPTRRSQPIPKRLLHHC